MANIRGQKVTNINSLKKSLKRGGGAAFMTRVPADGSLTVRFLTEPDGDNPWVQFYEHYDPVKKFYPCSDDCPGCREGETPSARYLANALDVSESRVVPLVMPKSLASIVMKRYDKYATLLDRDYELTREGTGFDTEYDCTPEAPSKVNVGKYDLLDLWEILEQQLDSGDETDDDDDDDDDLADVKVPAKKAAASEKPARRLAKKAAAKPAPVEDDDDDDDDEDDESESEHTRESLTGKGIRELRQIALATGHTRDEYKGLDIDGVIDLILGESDADDDDEDADDEDDETTTETDADDDELDEDALLAMSLRELKTMARDEYGVTIKPGMSKEQIVDAIFESAGDDDDDDDEDLPF